MQNRFLLLVLVGVLSPMISFSQGDFRPGYVIMSNGDSVAGYIDYRVDKKHWKTCYFRPSRNGDTQKYSPEQVVSYGISNDKRYRSIAPDENNPGERVFMEALVLGTMNLYKYKTLFYIEKEKKLVKLPQRTSEIIEVEGKKVYKTNQTYIGLLNHYMADCKLVADDINYKERDFTNLVQNYNRCHGSEGLSFKEKKPFTKFTIQALGGVDISNLELENVDKSSFQTSTSPIFGVGLDISSPRLNDKIFFTIEADYVKKLYEGSVEYQEESLRYYYDYTIDVSFLKIPIGFRYNFFKEAQTPYVKFGISQYFGMNSSVVVIEEEEVNGTIDTEERTFELDSDRQTGLWFGVGFNKNVWQGKKLFIEFRYERASGLMGVSKLFPESTTTNINALIGIRF